MIASDASAAHLGIVVERAVDGCAVARMTVQPTMVNGHGIAHGGMIFTLADTAFACACNSDGPMAVAAGAEITFVTPARSGDDLVAEAARRTAFGRQGIYDVTVRCGDRVVAEFRGRAFRPAPRP